MASRVSSSSKWILDVALSSLLFLAALTNVLGMVQATPTLRNVSIESGCGFPFSPIHDFPGIILQLGFQNALDLVHRAHSAGLTTYMSAG